MALSNYYKRFVARRPVPGGSFRPSPDESLGSYKGFLQLVGGSETFNHFKGDGTVTHRLYTPITTKFLYGDVIVYDGLEYVVLFSMPENGISGIGRHKEFLVSRRGEGQ